MSTRDLFDILLASLTAVIIVAVVWYVVEAVAYWKIFKKAGEGGWKSLIPIYNLYIQYKISWSGGWFFIFLVCTAGGVALASFAGAAYVIGVILSVIGLCVSICSSYKLSKAFGHGVPFAIGILFLSPIFILILGFGSSEYQGQ